MAEYRSLKNILIQPADSDAPAVEGDFDFDTREFVYDLSADQEKKYADALLTEGATKVATKAKAGAKADEDSE